jgi:hypothetical protein
MCHLIFRDIFAALLKYMQVYLSKMAEYTCLLPNFQSATQPASVIYDGLYGYIWASWPKAVVLPPFN